LISASGTIPLSRLSVYPFYYAISVAANADYISAEAQSGTVVTVLLVSDISVFAEVFYVQYQEAA
jgi:hypothetical protein